MKTVLRRLAAAEVRDAVTWYNLKKAELGLEFREELQNLFSGMTSHPERWPIFHNEIRRAVVHRFPYIVYYQRFEDTLRIFRVVHASRDPLPIRDLLP